MAKQTQYPLPETVAEALYAIQWTTADQDSQASEESQHHLRWLARVDKIVAILALVGGTPIAVSVPVPAPKKLLSYRARSLRGAA